VVSTQQHMVSSSGECLGSVLLTLQCIAIGVHSLSSTMTLPFDFLDRCIYRHVYEIWWP